MKKLNINKASEKELIALHKIGPATAKRVIAYRRKSGLFKRKDEIKEVDGISDAIFDGIRDHIFASSAGLSKSTTVTKSRSTKKSPTKSTRSASKKVVKKPTIKKTSIARKKSTSAKKSSNVRKPIVKKPAVKKATPKAVAKPKVSRKPSVKKSAPKTSSAARKARPVKKAVVKRTTPKVKTVAKAITKKSNPKKLAIRKPNPSKRKAPSARISKIQKVVSAKKKSTASDIATKVKAPTLAKSKISIPRKTVKPVAKSNELLDNFKKKTVNTIKKYAKDFIKTGKEKPKVKKAKPLSPLRQTKSKRNKLKQMDNSSMRLTKSQIRALAKSSKIEPAILKAIMKIESGGKGFHKNGTVRITFHGHVFYQLLKDAGLKPETLRKGNKDILYKKYKTKYNKGRKSTLKRLRKAMEIDKSSALKACSYGLFQLMGSSYKEAGFKSIKAFAKAHKSSEKAQVKAFLKAAKSQKTLKDLQNKDWEAFTNKFVTSEIGPKEYAKKLAKTYKKEKLNK